MPRKKVLLISYLFPPAGGVGVQRALAMARYLPESGCEVTVLAARNPSTPILDPSLMAQIPPATRVRRVFTPEIPYRVRDRLWRRLAGRDKTPRPAAKQPTPAAEMNGPSLWLRRTLNPDPQIVWTPFALRAATNLIRSERIDAVIVTAPPFSALRIGAELKRRFPSLKLISDFRDEWLGFYLKLDETRSPLHADAVAMERRCVEASDFVTAVTGPQSNDIRARYPDQPASKFLAIPNGYDPAVFEGFRSRPHGTDRIIVSLFGTVYDGYNSPAPLLQAIDRLPEDLGRRFEVRFLGRVEGNQEQSLVSRHARVNVVGFLPYGEALRMLEETDLLLLPVDSATAHAGKLFEYFGTGKPILALTPPQGELARLVRETNSGWVADPGDPAAIDRMLRDSIDTLNAGSYQPDIGAIRQFQRPVLIRRFAVETGLAG